MKVIEKVNKIGNLPKVVKMDLILMQEKTPDMVMSKTEKIEIEEETEQGVKKQKSTLTKMKWLEIKKNWTQ